MFGDRSDFNFMYFITKPEYRIHAFKQISSLALINHVLVLPIIYSICHLVKLRSLEDDRTQKRDGYLRALISDFSLVAHVFFGTIAIITMIEPVLDKCCKKKRVRDDLTVKDAKKAEAEKKQDGKTLTKAQELREEEKSLTNNFRHYLQIDIDNSNQKPTYSLVANSSQFFTMVATGFIYSGIYPSLIFLTLVVSPVILLLEKYSIVKICKIRNQSDVYLDELVDPSFKLLCQAYVMKLLL